ncbi:MAG: hypothetical protein WC222_05645 [Parachlamydiales bacterium]|jgi:hypothetical protein
MSGPIVLGSSAIYNSDRLFFMSNNVQYRLLFVFEKSVYQPSFCECTRNDRAKRQYVFKKSNSPEIVILSIGCARKKFELTPKQKNLLNNLLKNISNPTSCYSQLVFNSGKDVFGLDNLKKYLYKIELVLNGNTSKIDKFTIPDPLHLLSCRLAKLITDEKVIAYIGLFFRDINTKEDRALFREYYQWYSSLSGSLENRPNFNTTNSIQKLPEISITEDAVKMYDDSDDEDITNDDDTDDEDITNDDDSDDDVTNDDDTGDDEVTNPDDAKNFQDECDNDPFFGVPVYSLQSLPVEQVFDNLSNSSYPPSDSSYQASTSSYQPLDSSYQTSDSSYPPSDNSYQASTSSYQPSESSYHGSDSVFSTDLDGLEESRALPTANEDQRDQTTSMDILEDPLSIYDTAGVEGSTFLEWPFLFEFEMQNND